MLDLESFVYSAPFGIGPISEYVMEGEIGIDPIGYATWGLLGTGAEFAILGTTKFAVYAPVAVEAFVGELGLLTVLGISPAVIATAATGVFAAAAVAYVHHEAPRIQSMYSRGADKPQFRGFTSGF